MCGLLWLLYLMTTQRCHCIHTMEGKIQEMEFKRGSVNVYTGPDEGANIHQHSQRGLYNIHVGKYSPGKKTRRLAGARFLATIAHNNKVSDWRSKRR